MRILKLILISLFLLQVNVFGQSVTDSNGLQIQIPDSVRADSAHNINSSVKTYQLTLNEILSANKFINLKQAPVSFNIKKRQSPGKEYLFYLLSIIILTFGLFKLFYSGYLNNIFRVFFNTSLRQNQLTDLLLQARLPSLIFNMFFTITVGVYVWLLLNYYYNNIAYSGKVLFFCIAAISLIYIIRYCVLKFIGWVSDMKAALNTYIFVIFLINKIIGITLIPLIIFLAFAPPDLVTGIVILSFLILVIFFLMRFFRSYSLLQNQVRLTRFNFFIYVISLEILPVLVMYKAVFKFLLDM